MAESYQLEKVLAEFRSLLQDLYSCRDDRTPVRAKTKNFIAGFIHALLLTTEISSEQLQEIVEDEHFRAFGESYSARKVSAKFGREAELDWSQYEVPTYQRRG